MAGVGLLEGGPQKVRQNFPTKWRRRRTWRDDKLGATRRGELRAPTATTVRVAAETFMEGAKAKTIPTASGDEYKPATLRGYRVSLNKRILPALGSKRLSDVRRADVQELADRLTAEGLSASTVQNTLDPLRAIYRRAIRRDEGVTVNPTRRNWSCAGRTASVSASQAGRGRRAHRRRRCG